MKKSINLIITLGILAALACVLWIGFQKHEASPEEVEEEAHATASSGTGKPEAFTVTLEKEQATALSLKTAHPSKLDLQPQLEAFGRVIDPSPLVALDSEIAAAEAALSASKSAHDRTLSLVATHDASPQTAETSLAQFTADQIKVESLIRSARLQWGARFDEDPKTRRLNTDQLVSGYTTLIRLDPMPGDTFTDLPKRASLSFAGREAQPIPCTDIQPATTTDPKTQSQGFILRVDQPPFPLRPGMAVTAWLELPGPPRPGMAIPRSAILRHDGRPWVYVEESEEKEKSIYLRKPVTLDTPLDGDQGWFITAGDGLTTENIIVITGASSLLSEELKAQGGTAEID